MLAQRGPGSVEVARSWPAQARFRSSVCRQRPNLDDMGPQSPTFRTHSTEIGHIGPWWRASGDFDHSLATSPGQVSTELGRRLRPRLARSRPNLDRCRQPRSVFVTLGRAWRTWGGDFRLRRDSASHRPHLGAVFGHRCAEVCRGIVRCDQIRANLWCVQVAHLALVTGV